jgi:hypothetical protein
VTDARYPLAYDDKGDPITVPPEAVAWRVRRMTGRRGRPSAIYFDGRPVEIPIDGDVEDLEESGCHAGRYRLEAVDADGRLIPGIVALTVLGDDTGDDDSDESGRGVNGPWSVIRDLLDSNAKLVQSNSATMQAMATAFGRVEPRHDLDRRDAGEEVATKAPAESIAQIVQSLAPFLASAFSAFAASKGATPAPDAAQTQTSEGNASNGA